jgi:hypothetical protein
VNTTKSSVRKDFAMARELMRLANDQMKNHVFNSDDAQEIANELIAAVTTFAQWVEEQN